MIANALALEKESDSRIILPLPRMSFALSDNGGSNGTVGSFNPDRYLRRLAARVAAASTPSEIARETLAWRRDKRYQSLLARFHQRVQLRWQSSEESRGKLVGMRPVHQANSGAHTDASADGSVGGGLGSGSKRDVQVEGDVEISPLHLERLLPDPLEFASSLTPAEVVTDASSSTTPLGAATADEAAAAVLRSPLMAPAGGLRSPILSSARVVPPQHPAPALTPSSSSSGSALQAQVGSFQLLRFGVTNVSSETMVLSLSVHPLQESVGGGWAGGQGVSGSKILLVGTLTREGVTLLPGQSAQHELLVCFTAVGRFHFQFVAKQRLDGSGSSSRAPPPMEAIRTDAPTVAQPDGSDPAALLAFLADQVSPPPPAPVAQAKKSEIANASAPASLSLSSLDTGSALATPAPSPLRSQSTVRRRSLVRGSRGGASEDEDGAQRALDSALTALSGDSAADPLPLASGAEDGSAQFELDLDSSDEEAEGNDEDIAAATTTDAQQQPPLPPPELIFPCHTLMVVQTCL